MVTQISDTLSHAFHDLTEDELAKPEIHEPISSNSSQEIELLIDNAQLRLKLANSKYFILKNKLDSFI